jgi:DNA-binding CsgD family transcriptional regulator
MFVFREILKPNEVKHVAVRSSMRNGMLLGFNLERRSGPAFSDQELAVIDAVAPIVQMGDAMARWTPPPVTRDPVQVWADEQGLSRREREIAVFASRGMSNAEIAALLNISVFTVRNTLVRVFGKAGISRRSELTFEALQGKLTGGSDRQRSHDLLSLFYRTAREASSQPTLIAAPVSLPVPGVILPLM